MAFSTVEILEEFVEAANTVSNRSDYASIELWRRLLRHREYSKEPHVMKQSRDRARRWQAIDANREHKNAYMREYNKLDRVLKRRAELMASPKWIATRAARNMRYYLSRKAKREGVGVTEASNPAASQAGASVPGSLKPPASE